MAAQPTSYDCLIGLGSNLGDSQDLLESAIERLQQHPEIAVTAVSGWLQTKPIGGEPAAPAYLNGAARLTTTLSAKDLLQALLTIESGLGRERQKRWTSRTVDLDLLLHGQTVCDDPTGATVPHPWMAIRAFVLQPAVEIAGDMVHPQIGWTLETLWRHAQRRPVVVLLHGLGNNFQEWAELATNHLSATIQPMDIDHQDLAAQSAAQRTLVSSCPTPVLVVNDGWNPTLSADDPSTSDDRACAPNITIFSGAIAEGTAATQYEIGPQLLLAITDQSWWLHRVRAAIDGIFG